MKLVDNWKEAPRWLSVRALAVLALVPVAWAPLPPHIINKVPESWWPVIIFLLAVGGIAGRLVDQSKGKT